MVTKRQIHENYSNAMFVIAIYKILTKWVWSFQSLNIIIELPLTLISVFLCSIEILALVIGFYNGAFNPSSAKKKTSTSPAEMKNADPKTIKRRDEVIRFLDRVLSYCLRNISRRLPCYIKKSTNRMNRLIY